VSADLPDLTEPDDPALEGLVRALTAGGTARELAGRDAALEMFLASRRPRRRRGFALSVSTRSVSTAAAAVVLAGGIGAAYAAALPAPVQHIAYQALGSIGVPDAHRPAPSPGGPGAAATAPATPSATATATAGCPCPASHPGPGTVPGLVLTAAQTRIPAGGQAVLSGSLAPGGRPEAGVPVRLVEHEAGRLRWRVAGTAVTDRHGDVSWPVPDLTSNASFRLMVVHGGAVSSPVSITVVPSVTLGLTAGSQPGVGTLTARAPFGQAGDLVVLEERSGGVWYRLGSHALDAERQASFAVLRPVSGDVAYRVVLRRTAAHGAAVSGPVRIPAVRPGRALSTGRPAPP
jgi:hypothetical protein